MHTNIKTVFFIIALYANIALNADSTKKNSLHKELRQKSDRESNQLSKKQKVNPYVEKKHMRQEDSTNLLTTIGAYCFWSGVYYTLKPINYMLNYKNSF